MPYWFQADLENRISIEVAIQVLDDNNDGVVDTGPLAQIQADCDSFVDGYLRGIYDLPTVKANPPNQVKRISLDYAVAQCAKRRPGYIKHDWKDLESAARAELSDIRSGRVRLDVVTAPEPAANEGTNVWDGGPDMAVQPASVFIDPGSMGDF